MGWAREQQQLLEAPEEIQGQEDKKSLSLGAADGRGAQGV